QRQYHPGSGRAKETFPFLQYNETIRGKRCLCQGILKFRDGVINGLSGEAECTEMHPDAYSRPQILVGGYRFGWIHMDGLHKPVGRVGADSQQGDIGRSKAGPDVCIMRGITRIRTVIHASWTMLNKITPPQRAVSIPQTPARKMLSRSKSDPGFLVYVRVLPPVHFIDLSESERIDQGF